MNILEQFFFSLLALDLIFSEWENLLRDAIIRYNLHANRISCVTFSLGCTNKRVFDHHDSSFFGEFWYSELRGTSRFTHVFTVNLVV